MLVLAIHVPINVAGCGDSGGGSSLGLRHAAGREGCPPSPSNAISIFSHRPGRRTRARRVA